MRTGLFAIARDAADRGELLVAPLAGADVAGIDAVLVQRLRALGEARQQQVAVVVEVADERRGDAGVEHAPLDLRDRRRGFRHVDGDADHLGAGLRQLDALLRGARGIRRVGHGHRLDDDGRAAADLDRTDADADSLVQLYRAMHVALISGRSYHPGTAQSIGYSQGFSGGASLAIDQPMFSEKEQRDR